MTSSKKAGSEPRPKKANSQRAGRLSSGRVTLSDVAKVAGVSSMTVSRAINRPETVTEQVQQIVKAAIDKTGYVPNLLAGGLASSRTRLIGAVVPTLSHMLFSGSIEAFNGRLAEEGYQVLLALSGYGQAADDNLVRTILSRCPEGILLTGTHHSKEVLAQLDNVNIPVIEGWDLSRQPLDMAVGFSHDEVGQAVARFLVAKNHDKLIVVGAQDERAIMRRDSFLRTLEELGVDDARHVDTPSPSTLEMGRESFAQLFEEGVRRAAIFCNSDWLAHGVIIEARERGLCVPEDIAVIGFGNLDFAAYSSPSLTSIHIDREAIGLHAANMFLKRLAGEEVEQTIVDVGFDIIERQSTQSVL
ncbi:LacI family DNA-binding transcriptional regulator [uncultured Cohaesibacter sp.]|uniref:LacI family DNA-binding transcriptional regulator n=1 Tax=uncultured Cohaesibacter sp. TaxID=1002546 RepID=UPI0029C8ED8E|nr:LacI family DNA-binding transcriptional regulator [uncultured Cohaesibacter sp.]